MKIYTPLKTLTILVTLLLCGVALADHNFVGYGIQYGYSGLISPADGGGLANHALPYANDRILVVRQGEPMGLVIDAEFFGLTGGVYALSCALEGSSCPKASATFLGGGYHKLVSLDADLTLDFADKHVGVGFAGDLVNAPSTAGGQLTTTLGGEAVFALSGLGPLYLQVDVGGGPTFQVDGFSMVGVRAKGSMMALLSFPWVGIYGELGYQSLVPLDAGYELSHGPFAHAGLMFDIGTVLGAVGLAWKTAGAVTDVATDVAGGAADAVLKDDE